MFPSIVFEETSETVYQIPYQDDMISAEQALNIALNKTSKDNIWKTQMLLNTFPRLNITRPTWEVMIKYKPHKNSYSGSLISFKIDANSGEIVSRTAGGYSITPAR